MLMDISCYYSPQFAVLKIKLSHRVEPEILMLVALQIQCDNHISRKTDSIFTQTIGNGVVLL